jgi:Uncharacterized protein conserved in bacteria
MTPERLFSTSEYNMPERIRQTARSKRDGKPAATPCGSATIPTKHFEDAAAWEAWLEQNYGDPDGIWMKISRRGSGIPSVTYDQALDIALCFGWIDGQRKSLDAQFFLQRFAPRRKNSNWSKRNVEKVTALIEAGRMRPPGQAEIDAAKADGRWEKAYASPSVIEVPDDFQRALNKNSKAKAFFESLSKMKRYPFLYRLEIVKREETRKRKIEQFVELLSAGKTL